MQAGAGVEAVRARVDPLHAIMRRIAALPQITIAQIAGQCRGGGLELALAFDMRFAATDITRFGQPEVAMWIIPGAGGTTRLTRLLGRAGALEVLVGSADLSSEDAERLGLINRALPPDQLEVHVERLARWIADLPAYAVTAAKQTVNALSSPLDFGPEIEGSACAMSRPDAGKYVAGVLAAGLQQSLDAEWDMDVLTAAGRRLARDNGAGA